MQPEDFYKQYKDYVLEWIRIKNNMNPKYEINPDDFFSDIIDKLYTRNAIATYNNKHHSKASFKTWLEFVLNSVYNTSISKIVKHSWRNIGIDESEVEKYYRNSIKLDSLEKLLMKESEPNSEALDMKLIYKLINNIEPIKSRILIKLKLYKEEKIIFSEEEIEFISGVSSLGEDEIMDHIRSVAKPDMGLKDKDLPKLTGYSSGSVNGIFQRIVRKDIIEQYKKIKANG